MQMPCPNPVNCPGTDRPVINLTAEAPDEIKTFGYGFFSDGTSRFCEADTQEAADICAAVPDPNDLSGFGNPPPPKIFISNPQTCTILCPDATEERYSVVGGSAAALSQAAADAAALALACELANLQCAGPVTVYQSTAQTCSITCSNGQVVSFTTPPGLFSGASQNDANTFAYLFACQLAALLCVDLPPLPGGSNGGGSGNPPVAPVQPLWGNAAQSCQSTCAGGGTTSFTVPAGTFIASSLAIANAIAASYACQQAQANSVCLGAIESGACVAEFYSQILSVTGLQEPITWYLVSGSLPPGVVLADDLLTGTPTTSGTYNFTIGVVGTSVANGATVGASRSFSMKVMEISTASALPNGDEGTPYAQALIGAGYTGAPTWSVVSGTLPDGLTLHPSTGLISGTPTTAGASAFTVGLEDSDGQLCTKAFTITIEAIAFSPSNWWKLEEAAGDRVDSIGGADLPPAGIAPTNAPGVIANGSLHSPTLFTASSLFHPAQTVLMKYDGLGMDWCGWFRMNNFIASNDLNVGYIFPGYIPFLFETFVSANKVQVTVRGDATGPETIEFPIVIVDGEWYFWRVYFDQATGKWGLQIASEFDLALPAAVEGTIVHTVSAQVSGQVTLSSRITAAPTYTCQFDETGMFQVKLTDAQIDQVFNGGAGRTFP